MKFVRFCYGIVLILPLFLKDLFLTIFGIFKTSLFLTYIVFVQKSIVIFFLVLFYGISF